MKHNPKPEEKKAAGLDDDFAVKKDFAQSCTLRRGACNSYFAGDILHMGHFVPARGKNGFEAEA